MVDHLHPKSPISSRFDQIGDDLASFRLICKRVHRLPFQRRRLKDTLGRQFFQFPVDYVGRPSHIPRQVLCSILGLDVLTSEPNQNPPCERSDVPLDKVEHPMIHLVHDVGHQRATRFHIPTLHRSLLGSSTRRVVQGQPQALAH